MMPPCPSAALLLSLSLLVAYTPGLLAAQCFLHFPASNYPSCLQISPNVSMHWSVAGGSITWAMDVDGEWDWVGLGLSEGGMLGADLAVAQHDAAGAAWSAVDYWSDGFAFPTRDEAQDVTLVSVARSHGTTQVALRRPLVSCDLLQDRAVVNDTRQTVIFAYGTGAFGYHGSTNRGQHEVVLVRNATAPAAAAMPADSKTLDLRMPNFTIPANATTYQCVNLELPYDTKYHIYRYEPLIDNSKYVHHFVGWACPGDAVLPNTALGVPYNCLHRMQCEEFWMGWAPGLTQVDATPQAALAFGPGTRKHYLALQIHYTNMDGDVGQVDTSGFRLHYSPTLKQYDMGVLTIGSYDIAVPAGSPSWSTAPNVCPGACTQQMAAAGPVTLVESFYHMHQLGKSMITRHVRNGVELPPLGRRDYFSFAFQSPTNIPPPARTLLPGDSLITTCSYSGVGRTNTTYTGEASYEEMCFNFLHYFPYNSSISHCMEMDDFGPGMASCANLETLFKLRGEADVEAAYAAGKIVAVPMNTTYKPYQPTCTRTAPSSSSSSSTRGGGDDDDDEAGGAAAAAAATHHRRNVGGAVAAILIITVVGGVAIWAVLRAMRKKKQAEEEEHLFEKYNPSSLALPVIGSGSGSGGGGGGVGSSAAVGGSVGGSAGGASGGGSGFNGKGYVAV